MPVYNVPGVPIGLDFTPDVLADIFLGKITKWNDPRLVKANPQLTLPAADIIVVHRSDGSGTTVQNRAGQFVQPTLTSTTKAMEGALKNIPEDYRVFFTNPEGRDVYPVAGFTWILIQGDQGDPAKGKALVEFLWWATHDGQKYAPTLLYAPLPKSLVARIERTLKSVTAKGAPVLP